MLIISHYFILLSSQCGVLAAHIKVVQLVASEDAEGNELSVCVYVCVCVCKCVYYTVCILFQYVHR